MIFCVVGQCFLYDKNPSMTPGHTFWFQDELLSPISGLIPFTGSTFSPLQKFCSMLYLFSTLRSGGRLKSGLFELKNIKGLFNILFLLLLSPEKFPEELF